MTGTRSRSGKHRIRTGSALQPSVSETSLQPVPTLSATTLQPVPQLSDSFLQPVTSDSNPLMRPVPDESGFDLTPFGNRQASTDVVSVYASLRVLVVDVVDGEASAVVTAFARLGVFCRAVTTLNAAADALAEAAFHAVYVVVADATATWPAKLLKLGRNRYPATPLLVILGPDALVQADTFRELGAADVVEPPFPSPMGLLVRVLSLAPDACPLRADLREMLAEFATTNRALQAAASERVRGMRMELETVRRELETVRRDRTELERSLVAAREENIALSDACEGLLEHEERSKRSGAQLAELQGQLKRALLRVAELERENGVLAEEAQEARDHEAQLVALGQETLAQTEVRNREMDEREKTQAARIAELEAEATTLRARVGELEDTRAALSTTGEELARERAETTTLRAKLGEAAAELEALQRNALDTQVRIADVENELKNARRHLEARKGLEQGAAASIQALTLVIEFLAGVFATGVKAPKVEAGLEELKRLRAALEAASFGIPTTTGGTPRT